MAAPSSSDSSTETDDERKRLSKKKERADGVPERYNLGKTLGEGSFAVVRKGVEVDTGAVRAVKCMSKERVRADSVLLLRELEAGKKLRHKHLVRFREFDEDARFCYMVFDLIPGIDLLQFIMNGEKFSHDQTRRVTRQMADALKYCHSHFIAHRDIKLENVMVDVSRGSRVNAVLLDFGLCYPHSDLEDRFSTEHCGSADYCGPEILLRGEYDTHAADVWALGVVTFILVYGTLPFNRDRRNHSILFSHIHPAPSFPPILDPPDVPPPARDLLERMLDLEAETRITASGVMKHSWFRKG
jgi:serine/threonine protein kinase